LPFDDEDDDNEEEEAFASADAKIRDFSTTALAVPSLDSKSNACVAEMLPDCVSLMSVTSKSLSKKNKIKLEKNS
jgi:hypothetical protein